MFPQESQVAEDNYRLAPEAARFQLPLREIPMLSDYEGCYAKALVSVQSLCIEMRATVEKMRGDRHDGGLLQMIQGGSQRWQSSDRKCTMGRDGRVSKIVYACACSIFLLHCRLRAGAVGRPELQKVGCRVYPFASSLAVNEATHIDWLHKEGIVEGSLSSSIRKSV